MSLLKGTAKEALQGFDPQNDNPNNAYTNVPAGEYDAVLNSAEHKVFTSGWEAFAIEIGFIGGEYDGRKEFINIGFRGDNIPEFVYNKNIKLVSQLAFVCGLELQDDDWADEAALQWAFKDGVGAQFIAHITETKNKKDPSNPYRNFTFEKYPEGSVSASTLIDIDDEDLPF